MNSDPLHWLAIQNVSLIGETGIPDGTCPPRTLFSASLSFPSTESLGCHRLPAQLGVLLFENTRCQADRDDRNRRCSHVLDTTGRPLPGVCPVRPAAAGRRTEREGSSAGPSGRQRGRDNAWQCRHGAVRLPSPPGRQGRCQAWAVARRRHCQYYGNVSKVPGPVLATTTTLPGCAGGLVSAASCGTSLYAPPQPHSPRLDPEPAGTKGSGASACGASSWTPLARCRSAAGWRSSSCGRRGEPRWAGGWLWSVILGARYSGDRRGCCRRHGVAQRYLRAGLLAARAGQSAPQRSRCVVQAPWQPAATPGSTPACRPLALPPNCQAGAVPGCAAPGPFSYHAACCPVPAGRRAERRGRDGAAGWAVRQRQRRHAQRAG